MKKIISLVLVVIMALILIVSVSADEFPSRDITLVNPYEAGGTSDIPSRIFASYISENHMNGRLMNVNCIAGSGGAVGAQTVMDARADGYTILVAPAGYAMNHAKGTLDWTYEAFEPVCLYVTSVLSIVVRADSPYQTYEDLVSAVKANPGKLKMGIATSGLPQFSVYAMEAHENMEFNTVMENAYAMGAKGVLNYYTPGTLKGAELAEELGMFFSTQASRLPKFEEGSTQAYNLGNVGASVDGVGSAYRQAFEALLSDGQNHSVIVYTILAPDKRAASHYYSTEAILKTMQAHYGLVYSDSIEALINNYIPGEIETGNPDVKIYLCPGSNNEAAQSNVNVPLYTGDYDVFVSFSNFHTFMGAVAEVEEIYQKDIKVISTVNTGENTYRGFHTQDIFGNPVLNTAIINPLNVAGGISAAMMYNALNGDPAAMQLDGKPAQLFVIPWLCLDAQTYEKVEGLETSHGTSYVIDREDLEELLVTNNPDITVQDMIEKLNQLGDIDQLILSKTAE